MTIQNFRTWQVSKFLKALNRCKKVSQYIKISPCQQKSCQEIFFRKIFGRGIPKNLRKPLGIRNLPKIYGIFLGRCQEDFLEIFLKIFGNIFGRLIVINFPKGIYPKNSTKIFWIFWIFLKVFWNFWNFLSFPYNIRINIWQTSLHFL